MPADTVEILEGQEEGIDRHNSWGPEAILVREENNQKFVCGVRLVRCAQVYDQNKRFAPQFDKSVTTEIDGDTVLLSVGQAPDLSFLDAQRDGIEMRSPHIVTNDAASGLTSAPVSSSRAMLPMARG